MVSCLLTACAFDDEPLVDEAEQESVSANGVSLNGVSLNGVSLNGVSLNGVSLNGVSLNGVSLNGVSLNGVSLNGTTLTGTNTSTGASTTLASTGTMLKGTLSSGALLTLRIDSAVALASPNTDTWSYGVSYQTSSGWLPLCGSTTIGALQVLGTWGITNTYSASSTNFTFACRGATIAKCVEMGYKVPKGYTSQLATCVRLLRGDYCGTGVAYTVNGNQVNIYDALGIQADTQATWKPEAEWNANGALCISDDRKTRFFSTNIVPTCVASGALATRNGTCTRNGFTSGAVLISELP
jgi:hypothetical protein